MAYQDFTQWDGGGSVSDTISVHADQNFNQGFGAGAGKAISFGEDFAHFFTWSVGNCVGNCAVKVWSARLGQSDASKTASLYWNSSPDAPHFSWVRTDYSWGSPQTTWLGAADASTYYLGVIHDAASNTTWVNIYSDSTFSTLSLSYTISPESNYQYGYLSVLGIGGSGVASYDTSISDLSLATFGPVIGGTLYVGGNATITPSYISGGGTLLVGGTADYVPTYINIGQGTLTIGGTASRSYIVVGQGELTVGGQCQEYRASTFYGGGTLLVGGTADYSPTYNVVGQGTLLVGGTASRSYIVVGQGELTIGGQCQEIRPLLVGGSADYSPTYIVVGQGTLTIGGTTQPARIVVIHATMMAMSTTPRHASTSVVGQDIVIRPQSFALGATFDSPGAVAGIVATTARLVTTLIQPAKDVLILPTGDIPFSDEFSDEFDHAGGSAPRLEMTLKDPVKQSSYVITGSGNPMRLSGNTRLSHVYYPSVTKGILRLSGGGRMVPGFVVMGSGNPLRLVGDFVAKTRNKIQVIGSGNPMRLSGDTRTRADFVVTGSGNPIRLSGHSQTILNFVRTGTGALRLSGNTKTRVDYVHVGRATIHLSGGTRTRVDYVHRGIGDLGLTGESQVVVLPRFVFVGHGALRLVGMAKIPNWFLRVGGSIRLHGQGLYGKSTTIPPSVMAPRRHYTGKVLVYPKYEAFIEV